MVQRNLEHSNIPSLAAALGLATLLALGPLGCKSGDSGPAADSKPDIVRVPRTRITASVPKHGTTVQLEKHALNIAYDSRSVVLSLKAMARMDSCQGTLDLGYKHAETKKNKLGPTDGMRIVALEWRQLPAGRAMFTSARAPATATAAPFNTDSSYDVCVGTVWVHASVRTKSAEPSADAAAMLERVVRSLAAPR